MYCMSSLCGICPWKVRFVVCNRVFRKQLLLVGQWIGQLGRLPDEAPQNQKEVQNGTGTEDVHWEGAETPGEEEPDNWKLCSSSSHQDPHADRKKTGSNAFQRGSTWRQGGFQRGLYESSRRSDCENQFQGSLTALSFFFRKIMQFSHKFLDHILYKYYIIL